MRESLISFEDIEKETKCEKCKKCIECMMPICLYMCIISCIAGFTAINYLSEENGSSSS